MPYAAIKGLHMLAVIIWIAGLLLSGLAFTRSPPDMARLQRFRPWEMRLFMPAMGLTWILGITLAVMSHAFTAPWLWLKLIFVVLLSALHGIQTGTTRRLLADPDARVSPILRFSPVIVLLSLAAIVALVLFKPF